MGKYEQFRQHLLAWSKEKRGRQRELSAALGVSKQILNDWLKGRRRMSVETYLRIRAIREQGALEIKHDPTRLAHVLKGTEAAIAKGIAGFNDVTTALGVIKEGRLYSDNYATFEDYCSDRWGISLDQLKKQTQMLTARESSRSKF